MPAIVTERKTRFAQLYVQLGNATQAAIKAGYSEKSAASQGSTLLRDPKVQAMIEGSRIRRDIHADQTYQQLIALANAGMKLAQDALNDPNADRKEQLMTLEYAGRQVERVARCEGLMVELPSRPDEGRLTLQNLAQKLKKGIEIVRPEPVAALVEVREVDLSPVASPLTPTEPPTTNGSHE